jgi:Zn-dependent protease/CBS domain-containing protein
VETSFRLFRVAGIDVGINWSWLAVAALVTWTLAERVFPEANAGLSASAYWAMGAVAAALFFASIVLHELGHALQARREGIEIDGVTLWLFGGVARFRGLYSSAGAEFRIAVAGPLVTLAIAAILIPLAFLAPLPDPVDAVVMWLGVINAFVLVFNLLPALPLDGGRILRSALWASRGDLVWATRVGTGIARIFAFGMIGLGLLLFFGGGDVQGLWLVFLGWFLFAAGSAEAQQVLAQERLAGLRVADLMARGPVAVPPDLTLGEFMDSVVWTTRHTTYPVVDDGRAVGLLPFRRVAEVPRGEWDARHVRDAMFGICDVPVLRSDAPAATAMPDLAASELKRALVVDGGVLVGLLSITDVARALAAAPRRRTETEGRRRA